MAGHSSNDSRFRIGSVEINFDLRVLSRDGERVALAAKPFDVLEVLIRNAGKVVSKAELLAAVWGQEYKDPNTVEQSIRQIRLALGDETTDPKLLVTFPRRGYSLVIPPATTVPETKRRDRLRGWKVYLYATGLAVAIGLTALVLLRPRISGLDGAPASIDFSSDSIQALNKDGRALWTHRFRNSLDPWFLELPDLRKLGNFVRFDDFDGDGRREIVVALPFRTTPNPGDSHWVELDCFSTTGRLLWSHVPHQRLRFGDNEFDRGWSLQSLYVSRIDEKPMLYAAYNHTVWGNSFVEEIDPKNGSSVLRFVNTGTTHDLREFERASIRYLLVAGFNNEFDGGSLAVIDERKPFASSPQTTGTRHKCTNCPEGYPDYYFVFPRSKLNHQVQRYENSLIGVHVTGHEVSASKRETDQSAQTDYTLTDFPTGTSFSIRFDSGYEMAYGDLVKRGIFREPITSSSDCLHPAPVRLWTSSAGWTQIHGKCVE